MLWLVILLTITVLWSTEEWCVVVVGYIVNCYCLRLNGGVVCVVVIGYNDNNYCLRLNGEVVCVLVVGYIVNCYCLRFNRGVVCCCGWLYC